MTEGDMYMYVYVLSRIGNFVVGKVACVPDTVSREMLWQHHATWEGHKDHQSRDVRSIQHQHIMCETIKE